MSDEVSKDIADAENVARGVCTPFHVDVKKQRLKRGAFRQKLPTTGVSVYRTLILTDQACKERAVNLGTVDKKYVGLLTVAAGTVREAEALIEDSREKFFYGHADVFILSEAEGDGLEDGEPLPPHIGDLRDKRIDKILERTALHLDPEPDIPEWKGPALKQSACQDDASQENTGA